MRYSLTFGREKNTWADWGLIPTSPPTISAPEPNKKLVDIPGRKAGPIDLSRSVFGYLTYPRITGAWEFIKVEDGPRTRVEIYDTIREYLHGKTTTVITSDDPLHYFQGIFVIGEPKSEPNRVRITIAYDLEPIRYNLDGTEDESYLIR